MLWVKTCSGCCSLNGSLLKVLKIPNMQKHPTLLWPLLKEWNPFSCIHANQNSGDDQKWLTRFAWVLRACWNFTHMAETFDEQFGNVTKKTNLITQASYLPIFLICSTPTSANASPHLFKCSPALRCIFTAVDALQIQIWYANMSTITNNSPNIWHAGNISLHCGHFTFDFIQSILLHKFIQVASVHFLLKFF